MSVTYVRNEQGKFEKVGPGGASTDTTLSQVGKPADAAAVGNAISNLNVSKANSTHVHETYINQNAFSNIVVGSTTIAADKISDSVTFGAGNNITLTPDSTNDKITISAVDTTYSAATETQNGLMSAGDKTKINAIGNPNLLINSDFRNPVNQRGKTSYTGGGIYSIDRWYLINSPTLTVQDGSIKFEQSSSAAYTGRLVYKFEKALPANYYTISMKILSCNGGASMDDFGGISNGFTGIFTATTTSEVALSKIQFYVAAGRSLEIEWIKLEQGTIATPFIPRLYAEELALCQRYYEKRTVIFFPYGGVTPTTYYLAVNGDCHRVTKYKQPTLTATALTDHNNTAAGVNFVSATQSLDNIRLMTVSSSCNKYLLKSDIEFDAEIY